MPNRSLVPRKSKKKKCPQRLSYLHYEKENCMVSMATVSVILERGGVHTKLLMSSLLPILDDRIWSHFKAYTWPFYPIVSNPCYLFLNSVLRPFQDNFSSYETGKSVGGRKREDSEKNHLALPQAELGLSHMWPEQGSNPHQTQR